MRLKLVESCKLSKNGADLILEKELCRLIWKAFTPAFSKCLQHLVEGVEEETLIEILENDFLTYYCLIEVLQKNLFLLFSAGPLVTLAAQDETFRLQSGDISEKKFQLSRFCFSHLEKGELIFETPLAPVHLYVQDKQVYGLFSLLTKPHTLQMLVDAYPVFEKKHLEELLILLYSAKMIEEKEEAALLTWEFHDLVMHTRSRQGRHRNPYGGTFPFREKVAHESVCKPSFQGELLPLYVPNMDKLLKEDPPFASVVEKRESIREEGKQFLNKKQLGEFLFRAARLKTLENGPHYAYSKRTYPAGGAMYELEVYPLIYKCEGLERGLYHYQPQEHALRSTGASWERCHKLLEDAKRSTGKTTLPQVLFVIGARFQRVSWKYRSIAYAVTLKNTGVLFQTMYLTATAMELASCAVGGGNADLFSEAIGSNYYQETSVGEFILSAK